MEEASAFAFPLLPLVLFSGSFFPFFFFFFFLFSFCCLSSLSSGLAVKDFRQRLGAPALRDSLSAPPPQTSYLEASGEGSIYGTGSLEASQTLVLQITRNFEQKTGKLSSGVPPQQPSLRRAWWGACLVCSQCGTGWGWLDPKDHSSNTLLPPSRPHPLYCQSSLQTNRVLVH
uniref:Uncharacterized protein n=1 Tax=Mus musculus TaxID=10090 RepID=Q3U200_MOUSE|nr:unnamed protein product [Mus musculus]